MHRRWKAVTFTGFGRHVQSNGLGQDRAAISPGYRLTQNWRTEAGFLGYGIVRGNGTGAGRNRTITFTLSCSRPPARPAGVTPSR